MIPPCRSLFLAAEPDPSAISLQGFCRLWSLLLVRTYLTFSPGMCVFFLSLSLSVFSPGIDRNTCVCSRCEREASSVEAWPFLPFPSHVHHSHPPYVYVDISTYKLQAWCAFEKEDHTDQAKHISKKNLGPCFPKEKTGATRPRLDQRKSNRGRPQTTCTQPGRQTHARAHAHEISCADKALEAQQCIAALAPFIIISSAPPSM